MTPEEIKRLREPFAQIVEMLLGTREGNPLAGIPSSQTDGQPLAAPIAAGEQTILDALLADATGGGSGRSALLSKTLAGDFLTPSSNPFLQAAIEAAQRPTLEGLEETLSRTLPGRFTQAGQFIQPKGSSAFDRAAALATKGVSQSLADIATKMSSEAYEAERGRQTQAVALSQAEVATSIENLQAQALPRLIEDLGIERGLTEFQNRVQTLLQTLGVVTSTPLTNIASSYTSSQQGSQSPNVLGTAASIFGALFPAGL